MTVRGAEARDFERVTELLEELGRDRVTDANRDHCRAVFERQLADPGYEHLVAEDAHGRVIGFCSLVLRERLNFAALQAWIPDLIVDPAARRAGAGRALVEAAHREARARGCWSLVLESNHARTDAHRLYLAAGMSDTGKAFGTSLR